MKTRTEPKSLRHVLLIAALLLPAVSLSATQAGTVLAASAGVTATGADGVVRTLSRNSVIYAGDRLATGAGGRVQFKFTDGSIMALKPNSEMAIDNYAYEPAGAQAMFMSLVKGGFRTVTGAIGRTNRQDYKISTPVATIGIRGTLHEADFNPKRGLSLGVWDGGTQACNSGGCLDLGVGADFRFGFVGLDGRAEGRLRPPVGIAGSDDTGEEEGENESPGQGNTDESVPGNDLAEQDRGLFIASLDQLLHEHAPVSKYTGFATLAAPGGSATAYPWGDARLLDISDAGVTLDTSAAPAAVTSWSIKSLTAGGYINPGQVGSSSLPPLPQMMGSESSGLLVWGHWAGSGDVSLGSIAGVASTTAVPAAGFYAFGAIPSPEVIASLGGRLNFQLQHNANMAASSFPQFFTADSATIQHASYARGQMVVDVLQNSLSGNLDFVSALNSDWWHLAMNGSFTNRALALSLIDGNDGTPTGSWLLPAGSAAGSELGLTGRLDATLVSAAGQVGVLGGFDVTTISASDNRYANGIFYMPGISLPGYGGFAVVDGNGSYSWGNASTLAIDDATLIFAPDEFGQDLIVYGSMFSSTVGNKYILPGRLNDDRRSATFPPDEFEFVRLATDTSARIAWGRWLGNDMSLSPVDDGFLTTDAILEPGAFIFGDRASPGITANMTGTVDFSLLTGFPIFVDASGASQYGQNPSGTMTIDVGAGSVTGSLAFASASMDQWNLAYSGTFNGQASEPLNLTVLTDAITPTSASHVIVGGGTGAALQVDGTMQAALIGVNQVAGAVATFDVHTVSTLDANFARGVFGMEVQP